MQNFLYIANSLRKAFLSETGKDDSMKKWVAPLLSAALLTSCQTAAYQDGTYTARYENPDSHGWTEYVKVTVSGGKFTAVEFDAKDSEGRKKTEDEEYKAAYLGAGLGTYPADYTQKLEEDLLFEQDTERVDTVSGATNSSSSFKELVKKLEGRMRKGDTSELVVKSAK